MPGSTSRRSCSRWPCPSPGSTPHLLPGSGRASSDDRPRATASWFALTIVDAGRHRGRGKRRLVARRRRDEGPLCGRAPPTGAIGRGPWPCRPRRRRPTRGCRITSSSAGSARRALGDLETARDAFGAASADDFPASWLDLAGRPGAPRRHSRARRGDRRGDRLGIQQPAIAVAAAGLSRELGDDAAARRSSERGLRQRSRVLPRIRSGKDLNGSRSPTAPSTRPSRQPDPWAAMLRGARDGPDTMIARAARAVSLASRSIATLGHDRRRRLDRRPFGLRAAPRHRRGREPLNDTGGRDVPSGGEPA